jgi:hypothetical protein
VCTTLHSEFSKIVNFTWSKCLNSGRNLLLFKVHPRTGHKGPEREQRYRFTLSLTSALDGSGWSTPRPGRFTPRKETRYPFYRRLGGSQGRSGRVRKISPPTGIRSPDRPARSEVCYYTCFYSRVIALLSATHEILSNTLLSRLSPQFGEITGFITVYFDITEQHCMLCSHQILEKKLEWNGAVHQQFMNSRKPVIKLGGKCRVTFPSSLIFPWNLLP